MDVPSFMVLLGYLEEQAKIQERSVRKGKKVR